MSLVSQLKSKPLLLAAAAVAFGSAVTLALAHATKGWCPVVAAERAAGRSPCCASKQKKAPLVVAITGAGGQIGYAILFQIAQGRMLGTDQPIELRLLEVPGAPLKILGGVVMELQDCAFPLLTKIVATSEAEEAFKGCDIALLIGARPRGAGMSRADLLKANKNIFRAQGKALNDFAKKSVKVLVVGNPANTNAKIAMDNAPDLPKSAWSAMTRLDQIRATTQVALKANVNVEDVKNVVVWGNHSDTQYPDLTFATVKRDGAFVPALAAIDNDEAWAHDAFIETVQKRGSAIIEALGKSSAASAANAAVEHVRSWVLGTRHGEIVSMAVCSNGEYGVPKGLIFSFPCTCKDGAYTIIAGLDDKISEFGRGKMKVSWEQLQQEDTDAHQE